MKKYRTGRTKSTREKVIETKSDRIKQPSSAEEVIAKCRKEKGLICNRDP